MAMEPFRLVNTCRQLDDEGGIVGLNLCLVCRLVTHDGAASVTAVNDNIALFGIGLCLYRAENTAAVVCPVARVNIHVQRAEAEGTMVPRRVAKGQDLASAVFADEARIVL